MPGRHKDVAHAILSRTVRSGRREAPISRGELAALTGIGTREIRTVLSDLVGWGVARLTAGAAGAANTLGLDPDVDAWSCGFRVHEGKKVVAPAPPPVGKKVVAPAPPPTPICDAPPILDSYKRRERVEEQAPLPIDDDPCGHPPHRRLSLSLVHLARKQAGRDPWSDAEAERWLEWNLRKIELAVEANPPRGSRRAAIQLLAMQWAAAERNRPRAPAVRKESAAEGPKQPDPVSPDQIRQREVLRAVRRRLRPRWPTNAEYAQALEEAGFPDAAAWWRSGAAA